MDDDLKTGADIETENGSQKEPDTVEPESPVESSAGSAAPEDGAPKTLDADTILDTIVPDNIDWRTTVQRHPVSSVLAVALAGYVIGRTRGSAIVAGLTAGISTAVTRQLSDVLEGEFFEFE